MRPSTATVDNFAVTDSATGTELAISEVLYKPGTKQVVLTVEPMVLFGLNCTTTKKEGLMYLSGTSAAEEAKEGVIVSKAWCEVDGVSVQSIELYKSGVAVIAPTAGSTMRAIVTVANATGTAQTKTVSLYQNDTLIEGATAEVTVPANSTKTATIEFTVSAWNNGDVLSAQF